MAQTTTAINACDAVLRLDNNGGTLVDISGSSNSVELKLENMIGDFKTFASRWKGRIQCGQDASIKLKIIYSLTDAEAMAVLKEWYFTTRNKRTFQFDIPDSSAGSDRYQCEAVLENLSIPSPADEAKPVMVDASLLPDGELTLTEIT